MDNKRTLSLVRWECGCRRVRLFEPKDGVPHGAGYDLTFAVQDDSDGLAFRLGSPCRDGCSPAIEWALDCFWLPGEGARLDDDLVRMARAGLQKLELELQAGIDFDGAPCIKSFGVWYFRVFARNRTAGLGFGDRVRQLRYSVPYLAGLFDGALELHRRLDSSSR